MRLFVALNLADEDKQRLNGALETLRSGPFPLRWVARDAVHLTLQFLGEVEEAGVPAIAAAVRNVAAGHGPFQLDLAGIGAFPDLRRPRVVWLGVRPAGALLALHRDVSRTLESVGFTPDARAFSPHVTLARARAGAGPSRFTGLEEAARSVSYAASVPVRSLELMRSHTAPDGAHYEILVTAALEGDAAIDTNANRRIV